MTQKTLPHLLNKNNLGLQLNKLKLINSKDPAFPALIKDLVLKHSQKYKFDIQEQDYFIEAIIKYLPIFIAQKEELALIINYIGNEEVSKKNIIICGFFDLEYYGPHWASMIQGFKKAGKPELYRNIDPWIKIMKEIKNDLISVIKVDEKATNLHNLNSSSVNDPIGMHKRA